MIDRAQKPVALILFVLSGLVSLVFQVAWLRMLVLVFGNTVWAVSTLLTTFMAGLAIGSWLFGRVADRRGSRVSGDTRASCFRLYGLLEGLIGLYGLLTPLIFGKLHLVYVPLYHLCGGDNVLMGLFKFFLGFLVLLPPTILMGGSLPLLARHFTVDVKRAGSGIGFLYTANTFGAVIGTLITAFLLIPLMGLRLAIFSAAIVNFAIMAVVWFLTRGKTVRDDIRGLAKARGGEAASRWVLWCYFACGFAALAYEVIWNRILVLHLGSSVYAYSIMLGIYLLGVTLGAAVMSYFIEKIKRPVRVFAVIQFLIALDLILSIHQFSWLPDTVAALAHFTGAETYGSVVISLFVGTFQILIIPTLLFGASFPLAVKLFVLHQRRLGSETGRLYAFNTMGTILGSFIAGFLLLPLLGAQPGLLVIASINLVVGIYLVFKTGARPMPKRLTAVIVILLFYGGYFTLTDKDQVILTAGIFQSEDQSTVRLLDFQEDIYATVAVEEREDVRGRWRQLSLNGINVAGTSGELFVIQKLQGHLPLLLHRDTRSVLHIGFGSGGTAWAVSRYPVEKITVAEISRSVIDRAARYFEDVNHGVLADPRLKVTYTDGRNMVLSGTGKYDVILSDSIHPRFSGNGTLYTYDYYRLLRDRLNPNGLVSQWLPFYSLTPKNFKMIIRSFYEVFPYTSVWFVNSNVNDYVIVIGKLDGPKIDYALMEKQLKIPAVAADLGEIHSESPYKLLDYFLFANDRVGAFVGEVPLHTDDNMAVEYLSGRALDRKETAYHNYLNLLKCRTPVQPYLTNLDQASQDRQTIIASLERYERATAFNLSGQLLFRQDRFNQAFAAFDKILLANPDDLEPVEYFGSTYQQPFLRSARLQ